MAGSSEIDHPLRDIDAKDIDALAQQEASNHAGSATKIADPALPANGVGVASE